VIAGANCRLLIKEQLKPNGLGDLFGLRREPLENLHELASYCRVSRSPRKKRAPAALSHSWCKMVFIPSQDLRAILGFGSLLDLLAVPALFESAEALWAAEGDGHYFCKGF